MKHLFFTTSCYYFTILVGWSPMFVATQKRSHCWWFTQVSGWICTTYNWTNHDKPSTHPAYFMPNFGAPSLNLPSRWFAKKCSRWDIYPLGEYIHLFIYLLFIYSTYGVSLSESKLCSECRGAGRRKGSPIGGRATPPVTGFRPLSPCWVKQFEVGSLSIRNLGLTEQ